MNLDESDDESDKSKSNVSNKGQSYILIFYGFNNICYVLVDIHY